jgi:hypothetical protein
VLGLPLPVVMLVEVTSGAVFTGTAYSAPIE